MLLICTLLWLGGAYAQGQNVQAISKEALVSTCPVKVGWDHTTALVFPAKVLSVDRGHAQIMAKVERKAPNLLYLKAGKRNFITTNLHVVTADAKLYQLIVSYGESLAGSTINISDRISMAPKPLLLSGQLVDEERLNELAGQVLEQEGFFSKSSRKYWLQIKLEGIFQSDGMLFFRLRLKNKSPLAFSADELCFSIKDRKQGKHTSVREQYLKPALQVWENGKELPGHGVNTLVLGFPQFTISDRKLFEIGVMEDNGDREISLEVKGKNMLKARELNDVEHIND